MESFVSVNEITDLLELGQDIVERVGDCRMKGMRFA